MKNYYLFSLIAVLFFSCNSDDSLPPTYEYPEKLIGTWQQTSIFNQINPDSVYEGLHPYEWVDLEDGAILIFEENGDFTYSRYEQCTSGTYNYNNSSSNLELNFNCAIEIDEEEVSTLINRIAEDKLSNDILWINHSNEAGCKEECASIFRRS